MTDHAKILLGNLVQKYYSSRPHITRGCLQRIDGDVFWKACTYPFESERNFVALVGWPTQAHFWMDTSACRRYLLSGVLNKA